MIDLNRKGTSYKGVGPEKHRHGNVKSFDELRAEQGDLNVILYNRTSYHSGAGKGKGKLTEKTESLRKEVVQRIDSHWIGGVVQKVENGRIDAKRPGLEETVLLAEQYYNPVIVAYELSRFIRALDYSRKNNKAWPSKEEFDALHQLTNHIPLATILPPHITESQRHSLATKKTGKAGRPAKISDALAAEIKAAFMGLYLGHIPNGDQCGERFVHWQGVDNVRRLAKEFGVKPSDIYYLLHKKPKDGGKSWYDEAMAEAWSRYQEMEVGK